MPRREGQRCQLREGVGRSREAASTRPPPPAGVWEAVKLKQQALNRLGRVGRQVEAPSAAPRAGRATTGKQRQLRPLWPLFVCDVHHTTRNSMCEEKRACDCGQEEGQTVEVDRSNTQVLELMTDIEPQVQGAF